MYSVNLYVCVNICVCIYVAMIIKDEVLNWEGVEEIWEGLGKGREGKKGKNDVKAVLRGEILKKWIRIL